MAQVKERGGGGEERRESRGEDGEEAGKEGGPSSSLPSPVSLSANSLSPVLPSLDSTDWRGTARRRLQTS